MKKSLTNSKSLITPVAVDPLLYKEEGGNISSKWISGKSLLLSKETKAENLWNPFFLQYGLGGLTGPSDCGKSRLLRQLAIAIVQWEKEFLGFKLNVRHGKVYYVATEDTKSAIRELLVKEAGSQWTPDSLSGLMFLFDSERLIVELRDKLSFMPADLVVLDSWSDNFSGNPNDFVSVRKDLKALSQLAEEFQCFIVILHHNSKNSEKFSPDKNRLNGSQAIEAKLRSLIDIREGDKHNERILSIVKHNYVAKEQKEISYILSLEGDRLLFTNTGRTINRKSLGDSEKKKYDGKEWLPQFQTIKEKEQLSFEDARSKLAEKHGDDRVPSTTWFKTNYKKSDGQNTSIQIDRPANNQNQNITNGEQQDSMDQ